MTGAGLAVSDGASFGGCGAAEEDRRPEEPIGEAREALTAYCTAKVNGVGTLDVEKYASKCDPELASYSSTAAQDMSISLVYLHPTQETWERGDRAVRCIAVTLPPRSGSIKG